MMTSLYLFFMLNWCLSYNKITLFWTLFCKCCQKIPHKGIYLDKMLGLYLNVSGSVFIFPLFLKITLRLEGVCVCVCVCAQLCLTPQSHGLSLPGSSVHGIFQARRLEWVAISTTRGSFQHRCWKGVGRWFFFFFFFLTNSATWEALS